MIKNLGRVVGKSAYEEAVSLGYQGSEQQWLDSLVPYIGQNGNWFIKGNDTNKKAVASVISVGPNGYWAIDGIETGSLATGPKGDKGNPGTNGQDGITPIISPVTNHWIIGTTDTGIVAKGTEISIDPITEKWIIDGAPTNYQAITHVPELINGHWWVGNTDYGSAGVGIDSTLNSNSTNPVQNRVIALKIAEIETTLGSAQSDLDELVNGTTNMGGN